MSPLQESIAALHAVRVVLHGEVLDLALARTLALSYGASSYALVARQHPGGGVGALGRDALSAYTPLYLLPPLASVVFFSETTTRPSPAAGGAASSGRAAAVAGMRTPPATLPGGHLRFAAAGAEAVGWPMSAHRDVRRLG